MLAGVSLVSSTGAVSRTLVAVAGGSVYRSSTTTFSSVSGTLNSTAARLRAAEHNQLLYIADYRPTTVSGTAGVIGGTGTDELSAAGVDWTTLGISTTLDVCLVTGMPDSTYSTGTITVVNGVVTLDGGTWPAWVAGGSLVADGSTYYIVTRDSNTQVTLSSSLVNLDAGTTYSASKSPDDVFPIASVEAAHIHLTGTLNAGTGISYQLCRKIKVFNPSTNAMAVLAHTYGIPPCGCQVICTYRDRLVLAGPNHIWYMSRQGDPTDWDYGADPDDVARAVASTTAEAGSIGEPIVALIPHSDDYLVIGCQRSVWVLRGDPAIGGQIQALTREIGIQGPDAWCKLPDGSLLFLSRDGLYVLPPGGVNFPVEFSREKLPKELLDVDTSANAVSMAYDSRDRGVHLFITPTAGTTGEHWWIDWATKTFWPVAFGDDDHQPLVAVDHAPNLSSDHYVHLGGGDGYVRRFSDDATTDDATDAEPIVSSVVYGPLPIAPPGMTGIVDEIFAILDASSGDLDWELAFADTAEGTLTAIASATGTWVAGRNRSQRVRYRGAAAALTLSATTQWAIESVAVAIKPGGPIR